MQHLPLARRGRRRSRDRFRRRGRTGEGEAGGPWWKWALYAAGAWILISFISFAISAQIQKGKLSDEAKSALAGGPDVLAGQNILILGGDQRGGKVGSDEPGADTSAAAAARRLDHGPARRR